MAVFFFLIGLEIKRELVVGELNNFKKGLKMGTLKYLIEKNFVLPQNSLLNGKTKMDSENFYCQLGGMKNIASLPNLLRKIQHDP